MIADEIQPRREQEMLVLLEQFGIVADSRTIRGDSRLVVVDLRSSVVIWGKGTFSSNIEFPSRILLKT